MNRSLRPVIAILATFVLVTPVTGQERSADEQAVLATLERLFDAMRTNDGDMARSVFADNAVLIGTEGSDGEPSTNIFPAERFAAAIAAATGEWDEPFWDPIVQIQDHLATVWTKYVFYLDGTFSHCGIDAVILARSGDGWKIAALADSRQSDNCELPPDPS